ncbi:hypothetical protein [Vibrio antiquarius]|uniref:hypothetical protein n=1 Tax=Vibrio antiquarius (strain Ex25) TaxID=150340 RepID=UPI00265B1D52|nr:hypothetical protein [Vibrio antiquarius]MCR9966069.1 hypothetical protein [Vibrio antiquarius]
MKSWLEENKIYFETLAPVLLGVAAVLVSISSYMLTEKQLRVASLEAEPHFYLKEVYLYDEKLKKAYEQELRIFNSGAGISKFDASLSTMVEVEFYNKQGKQIEYIPLYGYYNGWYPSSEPKGELTLIKGHLNNEKFFDVIWALNDPEFTKKNGIVFLRLRHAVEIEYENMLGESGKKYFVDHSSVTKEQYASFMSNLEPLKAINLSDLNIEYLSKVITEHNRR